jgi:probable HAF family extracellular repeat protein
VFILGNLGGITTFNPTQINAISADGSTVVGSTASTLGTEAFRWTPGGGMVGLGDLAGGDFRSLAFDVSADGSAIVGRGKAASLDSQSGVDRAFRWTEAAGMQQFTTEELDVTVNTSRRVSRDGETVFGDGTRRTGPGMFQTEPILFRWTEATKAQAIDTLYPDYEWAFPISPGNAIWAAYDDFPVAMRNYVLLDTSGQTPQVVEQYPAFPTNVSPQPAGREVPALATDDGSIVFGRVRAEQGGDPKVVVEQVFVDDHGLRTVLTAGNTDSSPRAITDDGQMLLGQTGVFGWVWTRAGGLKQLLDFFVNDHGLDEEFEGWNPWFFNMTMSANGQVFGGQGTDGDLKDHMVVVRLTDRLPGDANFDGRVDLADFGIMKLHFGVGQWWNEGNFDGDRDVDLDDFAILKANFGRTAQAAVPEPAAGWLGALGALGLLAGWAKNRPRTADRGQRAATRPPPRAWAAALRPG